MLDPAYEAVIVSEKGLNPDSALALLAVEKVGQKRVSIFPDSVDDWAFAGHPVNKAADAADPKMAPVVAAPRPYPVNLGQVTPSEYPKIYIASGLVMYPFVIPA